jgi:hypothetical protein
LLGSLAKADAQNASASITPTHRTDQPPRRLGTVFTPPLWCRFEFRASLIAITLGQKSDILGHQWCPHYLIGPKEVLQPKIGKTRFCFFASAASRCSEFLIDGGSRFPLRVFLQQAGGVKPSLVIPEEFAPPIRPRVFLQYFVKRVKRIGAVAFVLQT